MTEGLPRLYTELADWWPVLSDPSDYAEEAAYFRRVMRDAALHPIETMLELGSGGGNNASHLKQHCRLTLVEVAPGMLRVSRRLNPECEHVEGDMRSVRLNREFDAVFVHDAVAYMTTEGDLRKAIETAYLHCGPGGAVLFAPDFTRDNFAEHTGHGGHDRGRRSLRYLEWFREPPGDGSTYVSDMVYLLREEGQEVRVVHDRHVLGLFPRDTWLHLLSAAGFEARPVPFEHSEIPTGSREIFIGVKPL